VPGDLRIFAIPGLPEATAGLDVGAAIAAAAVRAALAIEDGDVVVVAQKFVSKAEGAVAALAEVEPSALARAWAGRFGKDAAVVEIVLRQAARLVRMDRGVIIAETRHGLICANAGVDTSNAPAGFVTLLPDDPDRSAERARQAMRAAVGREVAVIVSDTFGRPWREGAINVAIGVAGLRPLLDYRGDADQFGRRLQTTVIAIADEIASAAELVMGKARRTPAAIVRGAGAWIGEGAASALIRPAASDLFR